MNQIIAAASSGGESDYEICFKGDGKMEYKYENDPEYLDYLVRKLEDEHIGQLLFMADHEEHELERMHAWG